jgi:hypothetical protein
MAKEPKHACRKQQPLSVAPEIIMLAGGSSSVQVLDQVVAHANASKQSCMMLQPQPGFHA